MAAPKVQAFDTWGYLDTVGTPQQTACLGDMITVWINFEINNGGWDTGGGWVGVGYGVNNNGWGFTWVGGSWYQDNGSNRKLHSLLNFRATSAGTIYYCAQGRIWNGDPATYFLNRSWANTPRSVPFTSPVAQSYFTVNSLTAPSGQGATKASSSQINLTWTKGTSCSVAKDTLVVRSTSSDFTAPTQGSAYSSGNTLGSGTVIYKGSNASYSDTGLSAGTKYYYAFYAENWSYYSSGVSTYACTEVTIGTQPANATACVGSTAQFSVAANAGTTPTYKWQVWKGSSWADCTASDGSNYTTANFTTVATTTGMSGYKYRCVVTDACGTTAVNTDGNATLTVNVKSTDPTSAAAGVNPICAGESTTLTLSGGGGGTSTAIKWYSGSCGGTLVGTGNGLSVSPTATTTYYGRYEDPAPCSYNTACASVAVTVNPASAGGAAEAVDSSVCSGTAPTINLTGSAGSVVKWQYSADNFASDVHDVANTTTTLDNAPAITATTYYRAVVQNGSCSAANSSVATVTIQSPTPTAFSWRSEADSGNWVWPGSGDYPWWANSTAYAQPANEVNIYVGNNVHASDWYNDASGLTINRLEYHSGATDARTLTGNALSFTDLCGTDPTIVNDSSATHAINVDVNGDDTDPLGISAASGNLTFGGDIDNNGQDLGVDAASGKSVTMSGAVVGGGGIVKTGAGSLALGGANSYEGGTSIENGTVSLTDDDGAGSGTITLGTASDENTDPKLTIAGGLTVPNDILCQPTEGDIVTVEATGTGDATLSGTLTLTKHVDSSDLTQTTHLLDNASGGMIIEEIDMNDGVTAANNRYIYVKGDILVNAVANPPTYEHQGLVIRQEPNETGVVSLDGPVAANFYLDSGTVILEDEFSFSGDYANEFQVGTIDNTGEAANNALVKFTSADTHEVDLTVGFLDPSAGSTGTRTLEFAQGSGNVTLDGDITLDEDGATGEQLVLTGTGDGTITGEISGPAGIAKSGSGTLTLSGTSIYTGNTSVNGGELEISGDISDSSAVYIGKSADDTVATLALSGSAVSLGSVTFNPVLTEMNEGLNDVNGSRNLNVTDGSAAIGTLTVDKDDAEVNVTGDGVLAIATLDLDTGEGDNLSVGGADQDVVITVGGDASVTISGKIEADEQYSYIDKYGAGTLFISGDNTVGVDSEVTLNILAGIVSIDGAETLGAGRTSQSTQDEKVNFFNDTGVLQVTANTTLNATFDFAIEKVGEDASTGTFRVDDDVTFTVDGPIQGVDGAMVKDGAGTMVLTGDSYTYSGSTTVDEGVLQVSSGTSIGDSLSTTVNSSGTLTGEGTVSALTLAGGTVSPGDNASPDTGTLAVNGNANLGGTGGGLYACDITGTAPDACDLIDASGSVTAGAAGLTVNLPETAPTGFDPDLPYYWVIANGASVSADNMEIGTAWEIPENAILAIEAWTRTGDDWLVVTYSTPTSVVLYNFILGAENGDVVAHWRTASETDTVGFWLERQDGDAWVRVNGEIIYAQGENGLGASYALVDAGAEIGGTYVYRLIELENDGGQQVHGPFVRTASALNFKADNPIALGPDGVWLRWLSREDEFYRILRSTNLLEGKEGFLPIATGIPATPPENKYLDEGAGSLGMYMIQVDEE